MELIEQQNIVRMWKEICEDKSLWSTELGKYHWLRPIRICSVLESYGMIPHSSSDVRIVFKDKNNNEVFFDCDKEILFPNSNILHRAYTEVNRYRISIDKTDSYNSSVPIEIINIEYDLSLPEDFLEWTENDVLILTMAV